MARAWAGRLLDVNNTVVAPLPDAALLLDGGQRRWTERCCGGGGEERKTQGGQLVLRGATMLRRL